MPLVTCPDCAREVSTAAPACIHCGRPMGASSSSANAAEKPMAGIYSALVLGVLMIVWVLRRDPPRAEEMADVNALIKTVHMLGNAALLVLALLALSGQRRAHGYIRRLSAAMVVALLGTMLVAWNAGRAYMAERGSQVEPGLFAVIILLSTAFQVAPWALYLYLFRRSRYP